MNCDQIRELLEAYALGALDADEQSSVEQHLAGCADCRRRAAEYAEVVNALPEALATASPLSPSPALKSRLLQSLEAAPAASSRADTRESQAAPFPTRSTAPDERPGGMARRTPPGRWPSWWRPRTLAALGIAILLVLALSWGVQLSVALAQERALRAELANLVDQRELVLEVIDSSETVKAFLRPTQSDSASYGKLYTRPDLSHVVAMAARLPQPPAGQAYHLWLTGEGRTQLAGVLKLNDQGFGLLILEADHNGPVYESAQLTLQPEGSATPPAPPILFWEAPR